MTVRRTGRFGAFSLRNYPPRALSGFLLSLAVFLIAQSAFGIVNTQPLFKDVNQRPLGFLLQGDVDLQQGNTQQLDLNLLLAARARYLAHEFLLSGAHSRSAANDALTGNKSFAHARYRYWFSTYVQWEFFGQIAQNKFQLISIRGLGGTGPRFVPLQLSIFEWALAAAYMYEVEEVVGSVDYPDGLTRKYSRANLSSVARLDFKKLTIRDTIYLQPAFVDPTNIRVLHQIDFAVEVLEHFSLTWTFSQSRDSIAPSDVLPYDNRLKGGFKLDL